MSQDWNIRTRGTTCKASEQPFEDGIEVYSRLVFGEEGYVREDYSSDAWNEALKTGAMSVWKNRYRVPTPEAEQKAVRKETAESLLRQLIETEDEANRNVIFILAVMLERQRILVERDVHQREDQVKIRIYEHRKSGESFVIPDPELKLAELEEVQTDVMQRLGIPPPESAEEAPAAENSNGDGVEKAGPATPES